MPDLWMEKNRRCAIFDEIPNNTLFVCLLHYAILCEQGMETFPSTNPPAILNTRYDARCMTPSLTNTHGNAMASTMDP